MERILTTEYVSIYIMLAVALTAWLCAVGVMSFKKVIVRKYDDETAYSTLVAMFEEYK